MTNQSEERKTEEAGNSGLKEIHHHHYHERKGSFLGMLFVAVGILYLLKVLGVLPNFYFGDLFRFWPVLLILLGLSLLRGGFISGIFKLLVIAGVIAAFFAWGSRPEVSIHTSPFSIEAGPGITEGALDISSGAGRLTLRGGADNFAEGSLVSSFTELKTGSAVLGGIFSARIEENAKRPQFGRGGRNDLEVITTSTLPLDIEINAGAADANIDFSNISVKNLRLRTGASRVNIIAGDKLDNQAYEINAGASSIAINLPKSLGARVKVEDGLSSRDFSGFRKIGEHEYESEGYASSTKRIEIKLETGVSNLVISWR